MRVVREQAISNPRRQTRRAAARRRVHLVASTGVAGEIERGERRMSSCLGANEAVGTTCLVDAEMSQMLSHPPDLVTGTGQGDYCVGHDRRIRIGPFAVDGSTGRPPWVITARPSACKRRAAARAGSISDRHPAPPTALAASLGQIVAPRGRLSSSRTIAVSSSRSASRTPRRRHAAEQWRTSSHECSHCFRQRIIRPQTTQIFGAGSGMTGGYPRA